MHIETDGTETPMTEQSAGPLTTNQVVSQNVRLELVRTSMTQQELTAALGKSDRSWLADRLNGRSEWRVNDIAAVARELGCESSKLLMTEDPR